MYDINFEVAIMYNNSILYYDCSFASYASDSN